jgi:4-diphosphocytidyl-2-C-methyl-D-erythritol kinase
MTSVAVSSPAKINLFLAVTRRRDDGYHDLVSLVAPLTFGDSLQLRRGATEGNVTLTCDDPAVPPGAENLAVRAAEAFRTAAGVRDALEIRLTKRIPMGAGLGGGSSNAAAVLRGLNGLFGEPLAQGELSRLAAALGSDCPLFLVGAPCVMRGRGERIELLPADARAKLTGRRVLIFKPDFAIGTPWAYGRLASAGVAAYTDAAQAEARLARWREDMRPGALADLLFNRFERVAFPKFLALPVLAEKLRAQRGVEGVLLSGSGSACFALLAPQADARALTTLVRGALGEAVFVVDTTLG